MHGGLMPTQIRQPFVVCSTGHHAAHLVKGAEGTFCGAQRCATNITWKGGCMIPDLNYCGAQTICPTHQSLERLVWLQLFGEMLRDNRTAACSSVVFTIRAPCCHL